LSAAGDDVKAYSIEAIGAQQSPLKIHSTELKRPTVTVNLKHAPQQQQQQQQ